MIPNKNHRIKTTNIETQNSFSSTGLLLNSLLHSKNHLSYPLGNCSLHHLKPTNNLYKNIIFFIFIFKTKF